VKDLHAENNETIEDDSKKWKDTTCSRVLLIIRMIKKAYCPRQTAGDGEEQGGLACCSLWGCKEQDTTWR